MEDFANLLQRDYGFKPQGKMAPMSAAKSSSGDATGSTGQVGAMGKGKSSSRSARTSSSFSADDDLFFGSKSSGRPAYGASSEPSGGTYDDVFGGPPKFAPPKPSSSIPVYDDIFRTQPMPTAPPSSKDHSFPVFDSPYDDDIFLGVRGTRTAGVPYDNVFSGGAGASSSASPSEDLLGGYRSDQKLKSPSESHSFEASPAYDDELLPGLGSGYPKAFQQNERASFISVDGSSQNPAEVDPFGGIQPDPFSNISAMPSVPDPLDPFTGYPETKSANGVGDGIDGFDIFSQPIAKTSSNKKSSRSSKDRISDTGIRETPETKPLRQNFAAAAKQPEAGIGREPGSNDSSPKKKEQVPVEDFVPAGDLNSEEFTEPPVHDMKESWITIDDVRLITAPTAALPPSRPAPGFTPDSETLKKEPDHDKASNMLDEMEEFATAGEFAPQEEEAHTFSSGAAAMNEAIERTEAKLKRTREKEKELKARNEDNEEQEQREEKEREEREKERHRRERDRERERDRAAVERATQEARDRAAIEARERAERAAVERATAEARERAAAEAKQRAAEKAAVERAAKEARHRAERAAVERANAEARERAERAAAERAATGRVTAEARERAAERAAVGRVSAEARERAAAAAAAAAREQQRRSDDLDDLFGARANSAPKQRPATSDFMTDTRPPKGFTGDRRSSTGAPFKKVSSVSGIDELTGLFGNPSSSEFQEVEGETPDRRKARLERDRRTLERAQKALADKHQRDLNAQREQAEKHRVGEALDAEIKRWAAGKEGNIRALLSTLQYVLWPECGWQPVSLTDLITGASVKKVYRRATLCVHPDKVQQKGATVQQKYIAEKVFDMLKEAWNKLNAEELF